ncbi:hypothetical protein AABC73_04175 [Pseudomonas sp. G.S.17]|uniref:hypothetical protein n=1 Tax=Pseudomonas sp. G.S.17 TaxID=3137451 RepID=UPI00311CBF26
MSTFIKEKSFRATLRSVHPDYPAAFDFSKIISEIELPKDYQSSGNFMEATLKGTERCGYLTATTCPRGAQNPMPIQQFWFLYREWDDGSSSYEIKIKDALIINNKEVFRNIVIGRRQIYSVQTMSHHSVDFYVAPSTTEKIVSGWKLVPLNNSEFTPSVAEIGPVYITAPNGNTLGVNERQNFGEQWWAYVACSKQSEPLLINKTVIVPVIVNILETDISDPTA